MKTYSFPEIVRKRFEFIELHGFTCVATSRSEVRYESKKVYVRIRHEEREGEIDISFGRIAANEEFSFTLFLRKKNPNLEKKMGERLAANQEEVRDCVEKLADALNREGVEILSGNDRMFDEMRDVRWWHFQPEALKKASEHRPIG